MAKPPKSVGYFVIDDVVVVVVVVFRRAQLTLTLAGIEPQQPWYYEHHAPTN